MLQIKSEIEADYRLRWPQARDRFFTTPDLQTGTPLVITNREGLVELSFLFFAGWLFTSILNQSKQRYSLALVPVGAGGQSSVLVLFRRNTHLAAPSRRMDEFLEPDYFTCPLDRIKDRPLSESEKRLCPVVNKLRYNLSQARLDGDVAGLSEPRDTSLCCASNKSDLWAFLTTTVMAEPDLYGVVVGGTAFPICLPYKFLSDYLTGTSPRPDDFGKLLEETLLWFSYACLADLIGENINKTVLGHEDAPVSNAAARRWHAGLIGMVERAALQFRAAVNGN